MKLVDLEPHLLVAERDDGARSVDSLAQAQGIRFLCPACFQKNGGACGTHQIRVWFDGRGVPDAQTPKPRWSMSGSSLADLTLNPSINIEYVDADGNRSAGCWHGFVTGGVAR